MGRRNSAEAISASGSKNRAWRRAVIQVIPFLSRPKRRNVSADGKWIHPNGPVQSRGRGMAGCRGPFHASAACASPVRLRGRSEKASQLLGALFPFCFSTKV
ncbi:hypothetical protein I656_04003 [Geobacillus sp. WSUCF1]|nr:hypothetical protein I656_04003 [Geobacillus sp. WSUCF1]